MALSQIVANNYIIFPQFRNEFTEGQIYNWRLYCYQSLDKYQQFTREDMTSFMDICYNNINNNIKLEYFIESLVLTEINTYNIVFMTVDSNIICQYDIFDGMSNMHQKLINNGIKNPLIVYIDTYISKIENLYKLKNPEKYKNVNFEYIKHYFQFINEENMFYDDNEVKVDFMYHYHIEDACKLLIEEEQNYFSINKSTYKAINEINDNVQLNIMLELKQKFIGSHSILLTNDKQLISKCHKNNIITKLY